MIDGAFKNNNRTFVQSFKAGENDLTKNSFVKYYMPLVESKKPAEMSKTMIMQQKTYQIIRTIKIIINSLVQAYQKKHK